MKSLTESINESSTERAMDLWWDMMGKLNLIAILNKYRDGRYIKNRPAFDEVTAKLRKIINDDGISKVRFKNAVELARNRMYDLRDLEFDDNSWGLGCDGTEDVSWAVMGLGKEIYDKCLRDKKYRAGMAKLTGQYESLVYSCNEIIDRWDA